MTLDRDAAARLVDELTLITRKRDRGLDIIQSVTAPPTLTRTIDGASALDVPVADYQRRLLRSTFLQERSWAEVSGVRFEIVGFSKVGDTITLKFEDAIAAQLRRQRDPLSIPANSTTRREIILRLAREAKVPCLVDDDHRRKVARAVRRATKGPDKTNSWDLTGDLASEVNWRRFSDGHRLVVGSDDWLIARDPNPTRLRENSTAVYTIDFDLDTGKKASTVTATVDARLWSLPPGAVVTLGDDMGPAEGKWLVSQFRRPLTRATATVTLTRRRHELPEPKAAGHGEPGEPGYVPGLDSGDAGSPSANAARERMVQFALSKRGNPYEYGGSGPVEYDCSGLVQAATAAAGHVLHKPSASQAAAVRAAGKSLPIDVAIRTRGALLFIQTASTHHVAISLGNGSTIEAMGEAYGVCIGSTAGRGWTSAGLWL